MSISVYSSIMCTLNVNLWRMSIIHTQ